MVINNMKRGKELPQPEKSEDIFEATIDLEEKAKAPASKKSEANTSKDAKTSAKSNKTPDKQKTAKKK